VVGETWRRRAKELWDELLFSLALPLSLTQSPSLGLSHHESEEDQSQKAAACATRKTENSPT
jgi:hypothetical protein